MKHYFYTNIIFYRDVVVFFFRFSSFHYSFSRGRFLITSSFSSDWEDSWYLYCCWIYCLGVAMLQCFYGYWQSQNSSMHYIGLVDPQVLPTNSNFASSSLMLFDSWLFVLENSYSQPFVFFFG